MRKTVKAAKVAKMARHAGAACLLALLALAGCDVPVGPPVTQEGAPVKDDAERVQVIVRLRFEPPAGTAPDAEPYKRAVRAARERFLATLDFPHRVVRTYETLPLVVLVVPRERRAALEASALVAGVEDDRLNAPVAQ
jgi:hypothetical protein